MIQIITLTIFNIALLAFHIYRIHQHVGEWRKVLAAMPTPMLGFASSYGVYGFNLMFVPAWVAVVMAAAYETTYVGLAALDALDDAQRKRAKRIALWAASISFAQNAIAGVFHSLPQLQDTIAKWSIGDRTWLYGGGSLLHAAQVWIAYVTADLTLHRPAAQAIVDVPDKPSSVKRSGFIFDDEYAYPIAAKQVHYPEPELIGMPLPIENNGDDPRRAEIIRLRDEEGLKFNEIALQIGLSQPSVTNIYHHGVAVPIAKRKSL